MDISEKPEKHVSRVPFVTVLASIVGLWATYFVLVTLRAELLDFPSPDLMLLLRLISTLGGIVVTIGLWLVLRPFDHRRLWLKIVAALVLAFPAALLTAQFNTMLFADAQKELNGLAREEQGLPPSPEGDRAAEELMNDQFGVALATERERLIDFTTSRYFMLLAWCALYLALLTGEKARDAERREQQFRSAAKAAELQSLRYQVNPHFLFNTLNSLSALVLTGKTQAAERMIQTISTFYRRSLADDTTSDVPLREEIHLQKLYLEIEAVRFPLRLQTAYDIPAELENALVPGMILQPLVENSVKHAVAPSSGQVTITLAAREEYDRLVVTISDNGQSAADRDDTRPGFGIGLTNVRQRLQARFGNEATVVSGHVPGGYATHLRMPLMRITERAVA
ncbi:sensor histidine kinase [Aurantiacibacter poecillastricola]|uniref:sensor histidine kinase n=1 Tax=Aurantiacibacter poecillastricola TaxID=3064385 RepID=UPI00273E42A6|nr:histidine kinase [Aurantiacibacter sp. 219JJ12-13]MDP5260526.1 histidine kinase [Aurantiacibacter sp. 219JJ12-13]